MVEETRQSGGRQNPQTLFTPEKIKMKHNPRSGDWSHLDQDAQIPRYREIAKLLPNHRRPCSVLDVGCGMGTLAKHLPPGYHYAGVDPSSEAVEIAQKQGLTVCVGNPDFWTTPHMWDCIVMSETLYYSRDPIGLLERFTRKLTPDGLLIVSIWQSHKPPTWKRRITHLWNPLKPLGNLHCSRMVDGWLKDNGRLITDHQIFRPFDAPWRFWSWTP